jgi:hypothetical protein
MIPACSFALLYRRMSEDRAGSPERDDRVSIRRVIAKTDAHVPPFDERPGSRQQYCDVPALSSASPDDDSRAA